MIYGRWISRNHHFILLIIYLNLGLKKVVYSPITDSATLTNLNHDKIREILDKRMDFANVCWIAAPIHLILTDQID
jgi:hypothetical protein